MADTSSWTPPTGPVVDYGHISRDLNISLIVIASCLFIHRLYIRIFSLKNWGADDYAATGAFALLITLSAFEIEEVHHGAGKHEVDVDPADLKIFLFNLPTMQLLYMSTSYLIKLSIILFLRRLHTSKTYVRIVWGVIASTTIQAIVIFLLFALQCKPPKALWDKSLPSFTCFSNANQAKLFYAHAGLGIVIDGFCLFAPIFIIWKLLMFREMQIRLTVVFSVGLFAVVCAVIRFCVIVTVDMGVDTTFNIRRASIWTDLECFVGFFVSCFPSLSPTFRLLRRKITGQSSTGKTSQGKPSATIAFSMNRTGHNQSAIQSMHHGKGSTGDIPMYSVTGIAKASSNDSEDNVAAANGNMYNNLDFKVHVEKEVYTSKV
ncbi:hypothetical protein HYPSUDRAFT_73486 [Hypholoma sublateritium FD-334 SS-4]|uniref:Rhodopsin domain-containing protein n=1 Tax=Hypholoma sublateritium (strain FD-334 SS-4) TaxID=945553 RepID=A0A0D2QEH9_HYPSF|nr:hypothetical protein HYPSUDRAFT_73486 [Hypholoma sublateritium FD-334 SS-4]